MSNNLKRMREKKWLSLTDLAEISGVNRVTIHRIETGKQKPLPRTVRKLANALKVDVEQLISNRTGGRKLK